MAEGSSGDKSDSVIAILGVPFDAVTMDRTVDRIAGMIGSRRPHCVATANVDFLVQAQEDQELMRILFDSDLVLCDGMPLVWAARWLGGSFPERVAGSDLVPRLLAESVGRGWRIFFLGGSPESVQKAEANVRAQHKGIQIVGAYSPPFKPLLKMDHEEIVSRVRAAAPDILFVAFGCPKQEKWINMHCRALGVPVSVGVGATIDFLAGTFKRAPRWMQRTGMEWIFRVLQEPKRLAKRYLKDAWVFGWSILRQVLLMRRYRRLARVTPRPQIETSLPDFTLLRGPSRLDAEASRENVYAWEQALLARPCVLDLSETGFLDSTGMGAMVRMHRKSKESGHAFVIICPPGLVRRSLEAMKMENLFMLVESLKSAGEWLKRTSQGPIQSGFSASGCPCFAWVWDGEITAANADETFTTTLLKLDAMPENSSLTIDLSGVRFVDSSGVGVMLRLKKQARRLGCALRFAKPTEAVRNVMRITKLEAFLTRGPL